MALKTFRNTGYIWPSIVEECRFDVILASIFSFIHNIFDFWSNGRARNPNSPVPYRETLGRCWNIAACTHRLQALQDHVVHFIEFCMGSIQEASCVADKRYIPLVDSSLKIGKLSRVVGGLLLLPWRVLLFYLR